ncbi:sigma-70 family RNA polymerase sigma factor [Staphylococcus sp. FSL W8-0271]|uniref:sigma-70 family RNA polymerase sigma factor n=1 Tax=Staphylococcus sp. FSL W8-0271 TaxID=2954550 RepID=UPI0030FA57FF
MSYDKATVKEFILNYHKTINNSDAYNEDIDIDNNVEESIFYNELEAVIERVATEKEHNLFLIICNGVSFEKAGNIFGVKEARAKQMLNRLLDKLE